LKLFINNENAREYISDRDKSAFYGTVRAIIFAAGFFLGLFSGFWIMECRLSNLQKDIKEKERVIELLE
jgi:uncharacterized membrane protein YciS (DUF1049 family)